MAINGITFNAQNVAAKNDGGLYQTHYGDGVLWGCSMTLSGNNLVISAGQFIVAGRVLEVDGSTNIDLSGRTYTNGYLQVLLTLDMSQPAGSQWGTSFVQSTTTSFPALTQNNINGSGTVYQFEMAVIQISGGSLTSIVSSMPNSRLVSNDGAIFNIPNGGIIRFQNGGTDISQIRCTSAGGISMGGASGGSLVNGFNANGAGNAVVFGNGQSVYIRPNGQTSTNGQVEVASNGDITANGKLYGVKGIEANFPAGGYIDLKDNGTLKGRIQMNTSGRVDIGHYANGSITNGVASHNDGSEYIYGNGASIYIRPNGTANASGQVEFTTGGQQIGGHPMTTKDVATVSIPAGNTVKNLTSITGLDASGIYLVAGNCNFGHTNSDTGYARLIIGSTSTGVSVAQSVYCAGTGDRNLSIARLVTGLTAQYLNFSSSYAGTATSCHLAVVRLG